MTQFIWDASHYDGYLDRDTLQRAQAEGIVGLHHKIAEGVRNTERGPAGDYDDTALGTARSLGYEFLGAYMVVRTLDVATQVAAWIAEADRGEPWWRSFPGFYWVVDLELWQYDKVQASHGVGSARLLRDQTGVPTLLYASHGQYGDQLSTWDGPLINADYFNVPAQGFKAMYPGDNWAPRHSGGWYGGWTRYSSKVPALLQYTSQATIAGRTTCDVNAFRGSLDDLRALLKRGGIKMLDRCKSGETSDAVGDLQTALVARNAKVGDKPYGPVEIDRNWGKRTSAALASVIGDDGSTVVIGTNPGVTLPARNSFGVTEMLALLDAGKPTGAPQPPAQLPAHTHKFDPAETESGPAIVVA